MIFSSGAVEAATPIWRAWSSRPVRGKELDPVTGQGVGERPVAAT